MSGLSRAIVPAAIAASLVVLFGLLYGLGYSDQYTVLLTDWGATPFRFPFLDTHAVLSAIECHRRGIDVYVENPCDALGRIHVYSPLWLSASALPITTAWTPAVGLGSVALFLLSLTLLPPGRGWWQTGVITLGTISSTTAFAIERANIDIVVFLLAVLVARLVQHSRGLRLLGYSVALLSGMLKFYPATLLILAVRERLTVFLAIGAVSAGALAGFIALYAHDLPRVLSSIPSWSYFNFLGFGARGPGERYNRFLVVGCALVLLLMWGETVRLMIDPVLRQFGLPAQYVDAVNGRVWVLRELTWWAVATMLTTLLIALLLRSQVAQDLAARFSPRRRP